MSIIFSAAARRAKLWPVTFYWNWCRILFHFFWVDRFIKNKTNLAGCFHNYCAKFSLLQTNTIKGVCKGYLTRLHQANDWQLICNFLFWWWYVTCHFCLLLSSTYGFYIFFYTGFLYFHKLGVVRCELWKTKWKEQPIKFYRKLWLKKLATCNKAQHFC